MIGIVLGRFTLSDSRPNRRTDVFYWQNGRLVHVEYNRKVDTDLLTFRRKLFYKEIVEHVFDFR